MNLFEFKINKEACFAYWAQYMAGWSWNKKETEKNYYLDIIGGLNNKEKEALDEFMEILNKSNSHGYLWLWDRYTGKSIDCKEERNKWEKIKGILNNSFEKIWKIEYPKLENWKEVLSNFEISDLMKGVVTAQRNFLTQNWSFQ